jgi:hypothetical protein
MKYYFSPVSQEAMEAAYIVEGEIGFCASIGQVGPNAYTGLTDDRFALLRQHYSKVYGREVVAERDHLGRAGENSAEWIVRDIAHGFEECMLHIFDQAGLPSGVTGEMKLKWQIGPGEDDSREFLDSALHGWAMPTWVSFPTGCLIEGLGNRGQLNLRRVYETRRYWPQLLIRAHNCDYLPAATIKQVKMFFDGMNIAPQVGCFQSCAYLIIARAMSLPIQEWEDACWADQDKIKRWGLNERNFVQGMGHYHYDKIPWRQEFYTSVVERISGFMQWVINL